MKNSGRYTSLILLSTLTFSGCQENNSRSNDRPNIILILADDLGYGELGCYGQEKIETPNIDALSEKGVRFTQHYSGSAVSAPSRCSLLSGLHPGHMSIRGNHEWGSRGDVWNYRSMINDSTLEGQYPMPDSVTIATLLKHAGYKTGMVGKWGLGAPHSNSVPNKMRFDYFCGYNCQRIAHTYYPVHLWENDHRILLGNDTVKPHLGLAEGSDPNSPDSYSNFSLSTYAPDVMQEKMLSFIEENKSEPFFMYWASPIPHLPLQAPQRWVDYYHDKFGDEDPLINASYYPHRYPRAAYAAMISYLDEQVGELLTKLKELGIYENSIIIFTSDNGPTYIEADVQWFESAGILKTDSKTNKGYLNEGGIRVPMIVSWPAEIKNSFESDHISAFWDIMPTLTEIAGTMTPDNNDGISFLPELLGQKQNKHDHLYWEFSGYSGQQALRMGPWKAIRKNIKKGNLDIELYNLETDILEENNIAKQKPDLMDQIDSIFRTEHTISPIERFRFDIFGEE